MIFSLFDIKSQTYGPMIEARTVDEAKRILATAIACGKDAILSTYTEDFNLVCVREEFDTCSDLISFLGSQVVCSAIECKKLAFSVKSIDLIENDSTAVELAEQPKEELCEV